MRTALPARWARAAIMTSLVACAVLTACGTPPTTPAAAVPDPAAAAVSTSGIASVGRIGGTGLLVAVVTDGDEVVAYVCDGDTAIGERFFGTLDGDRAVLRSDGAAELDLTVGDGGAAGTFTSTGGMPTAFSTAPASGAAGLYFADGILDGEVYGAGWIVLADGTQTGTQTRDRRDHRAAPPLDRGRVEVVRGTRPPTTTATTTTAPQPSKPQPEGGRLEQQVPVRVVDQAGVARARLCAADPARCA